MPESLPRQSFTPRDGQTSGVHQFLLKSCPRCLGDLMREPDELLPHTYACIQCGWSGTSFSKSPPLHKARY